jgi:hypothetical protein
MQEEVGLEMLESVPGSIVDTAIQYVGTMNEILPSVPFKFLVQLLDSPLLGPEPVSVVYSLYIVLFSTPRINLIMDYSDTRFDFRNNSLQ